MVRHPAKFSKPILEAIEEIASSYGISGKVIDPFAGVGGVHSLGFDSWGVELEPEWAAQHPRNLVGDALNLPFKDKSFGVAITSPTYANRMADHHEAKDASKRNTYKHTLGRNLSAGSSASMQWGEAYCTFHYLAWKELRRVLDGWLILNCSDHIRKGERQYVVDWHQQCLVTLGFGFVAETEVCTQRNRQGQNHDLRVDSESVLLFKI